MTQLAVVSLFAGRSLLRSSSKLTLARILFAGCLLSHLVVKLVKPADRTLLAKFVNLDEMHKEIKVSVVLFGSESGTEKAQGLLSQAPALSARGRRWATQASLPKTWAGRPPPRNSRRSRGFSASHKHTVSYCESRCFMS